MEKNAPKYCTTMGSKLFSNFGVNKLQILQYEFGKSKLLQVTLLKGPAGNLVWYGIVRFGLVRFGFE